MGSRRRWPWFALMLLATLLLAYVWAVRPRVPAGYHLPKQGTIAIQLNNAPIANAYVGFVWRDYAFNPLIVGHGPNTTRHRGCIHIDLLRTDNAGRFYVPASADSVPIEWPMSIFRIVSYHWRVEIYAPGYERAEATTTDESSGDLIRHMVTAGASPTEQQLLPPILLVESKQPASSRAHELLETLVEFSCSPYRAMEVPFAAQLYEEAWSSTCANEDGLAGAGALDDLAYYLRDKRGPNEPASERTMRIEHAARSHHLQTRVDDAKARAICDSLGSSL